MLRDLTIHPTLPVADLTRARAFYEEVLGFTPSETNPEGVFYPAASGTFLALYPSNYAGQNPGTAAVFFSEGLDRDVAELRERGVVFEEYDFPELRTEEGIAALEHYRAAWFRDPDGNILGVFERSRP